MIRKFLVNAFLLMNCWIVFAAELVIAQEEPMIPVNQRSPVQAKDVKFKFQKGIIDSDEAYIFEDSNFDANISTVLSKGQSFFISIDKVGPFYKIQLAPDKVGYILDSDVRPVPYVAPASPKDDQFAVFDQDPKQAPAKKETPKAIRKKPLAKKYKNAAEKESGPRRSFERTRFRGLVLQSVNYTEETISKVRSESLLFYGLKWSGANTAMTGLYTDINVLFHSGAPSYYSDKTGNSASGWFGLVDFLFELTNPMSRDSMYYYGFGPMLKYSHLDVTLTEGGRKTNYSLDDMILGAAFNLGMAYRISSFAVRADAKYYWEKQKYLSLGLAFQMDF